jgi:diketogulonate reductase-like aldo/keto reductase
VYEATKVALDNGYRHIDTAHICKYSTPILSCQSDPPLWIVIDQTEKAVGKAIREHPTVTRDEVFVVSKLWQTFHQPEHVQPAINHTLQNLGFESLDLYLMHWPMAWEFKGYEFEDMRRCDAQGHIGCVDVPVIDTWRAMEKLVENGSTKLIGVSNFTIPMLEQLLAECKIKPVVNEIEVHPSFPQTELVEYCQQKGIVVSAYSPLGNPGYRGNNMPVIEDPKVRILHME